MKRLLIALGILLIVNLVTAQSWTSSSRISTSETMFEVSSVIDDYGNVISFGYFTGTLTAPNGDTLQSYGDRDYFVIKFLI